MALTVSRLSSINIASLLHFLYVILVYDVNKAHGDYILIMESFPVIFSVVPESLFYAFYAIYIYCIFILKI